MTCSTRYTRPWGQNCRCGGTLRLTATGLLANEPLDWKAHSFSGAPVVVARIPVRWACVPPPRPRHKSGAAGEGARQVSRNLPGTVGVCGASWLFAPLVQKHFVLVRRLGNHRNVLFLVATLPSAAVSEVVFSFSLSLPLVRYLLARWCSGPLTGAGCGWPSLAALLYPRRVRRQHPPTRSDSHFLSSARAGRRCKARRDWPAAWRTIDYNRDRPPMGGRGCC